MADISDYVDRRFEGMRDSGIKETFDHIRQAASSDGFEGEYFTLCRLVGEKIGMSRSRSKSMTILGKAYDVYRLLSDREELVEELRDAFSQDDPFEYMEKRNTVDKINKHLDAKGNKRVNHDLLVFCMYAADEMGQSKFFEANRILLKKGKGLHPFIRFRDTPRE